MDRKRTASSAAGGIFRCGGRPRDAISKRRFSSSSLFALSSRPAVWPWSRLLGAHSPLRRRCLDGSSVPSDQPPDVQPCTGRMESPGSMRSMALAFLLPRPTMIQRLSPRAPASRGEAVDNNGSQSHKPSPWAEEPITGLCVTRGGHIFATMTDSSIAVWQTRVCLSLSSLTVC